MNARSNPNHASGHVLPPRVLLGAAGALLTLTIVTVAVSRVDLGAMNGAVALAIAFAKASVVALFFMHLKYENRFLAVILVSCVLFAAFFLVFVIFDTTQYQQNLRDREAAVERRAPIAP